MPFVTTTTSQLRSQQLKQKNDFAAYAINKQAIENGVFVASIAGNSGFAEMAQANVFFKPAELQSILATNKPNLTIPLPVKPDSLSSTSVTAFSFVISWMGGNGASFYTYTLNGIPATPSSVTPQTATFSTGLTMGTSYTVVVIATNAAGSSISDPISVTTLITPPAKPDSLTSSAVTQTGFVLSWTGGDGATSYTFTTNGNALTPSSSTSQSATFSSGLVAATPYTVIVRAINSVGSTLSDPFSVTTLVNAPTKPSSLTSSSITASSFVVSWTGGSGATSYTYTLNGNAVIPSSSTSQSATFSSGLTAATPYNISVTATNAGGSTASDNFSVTTLISPPTKPSSLTSSSVTQTSFVVSWTGGSGASSYTYTANGNAIIPSSSTSQSATFSTGLIAATPYSVIVTATNAGGSTASDNFSVTTLINKPTKPASLASSAVTQTSFVISWTGGAGATSYTYTANGNAVTPSSSTSQSATFSTSVVAATSYDLIVRATNAGGSTDSDHFIVTTLVNVPTSLTSLISSSVTEAGFVISWTGGSGATSYTYTVNGNAVIPDVDNGVASNSATFTGLSDNTTYAIIVTATNAGGSVFVSSSVTTLLRDPTQPSVITISGITQTGFTANWVSGDATITSYTYTLNGSVVTPSTDNGLTSGTAIFTGLVANTPYELIVTAVNPGGTADSPTANLRTLVDAPTQPTSISFSGTTQAAFTASWSDGVGATYYTYTLNGSVVIPSVDNGVASKSATFTGLAGNTLYALIVTARNAGGSTPSSSSSVTTLVAAPTQPTTITFSDVTQTAFTSTWSAGADATSYTYTLNGSAVTPSTDNGVASKSATFTGLVANTAYALIVIATNAGGSTPSSSSSITTLANLATYTPTNTTTLTLWLDGTDPAGTGTAPASGAAVTTWKDKSSAGVSFSGSATFNSTTKGLTFNGTSNYFSYSSVPLAFTGTVAIVVNMNASTGQWGSLIQLGPDYAGMTLRRNGYNAGFTALNSDNVTRNVCNLPEQMGSLVIYIFTFTGSAAGLTLFAELIGGGTLTTVNGTSPSAINTGNKACYLGTSANLTANFKGEMYEVASYNTVLSTIERQKLEGYLAWKWGLNAQLPSDHPHFSATPLQDSPATVTMGTYTAGAATSTYITVSWTAVTGATSYIVTFYSNTTNSTTGGTVFQTFTGVTAVTQNSSKPLITNATTYYYATVASVKSGLSSTHRTSTGTLTVYNTVVAGTKAVTSALINIPLGGSIDPSNGDLYFSNAGNNNITKIAAADNAISTFSSGLPNPGSGSVVYNSDIYICCNLNNTIRKINLTGTPVISTFASGITGPQYITSDGAGSFYVSNNTGIIYKVTSAGTVSTYATAAITGVANILGLAYNTVNGHIYFCNSSSGTTGSFRSIATGTSAATVIDSSLPFPVGVKMSPDNNNVYYSIANGYIIKKYNISTTVKSTIIGSGVTGTTDNIVNTVTQLGNVYDIVPYDNPITNQSILYVLDQGTQLIRKFIL